MAFELPALPYAQDALAPHISAETMEYHYGKHHKTYVDNLNKAVAGTADENASLEDIIMKAEGPLFNNAAQVWNHTFFWNSLSPNGGGQPTGAAAERIAPRPCAPSMCGSTPTTSTIATPGPSSSRSSSTTSSTGIS